MVAKTPKKTQKAARSSAADKKIVTSVTNAVLNNVRQRLSVVQRPRMDTTVRRYLQCVTNPFDPRELSRGIWATGAHQATAVVRRATVCTVNLNANPGSPAINSGVDIFIHTNCTYSPWVTTATNAAADWSGVKTVNVFNKDATATIPVGSSARVVAAGVRITCLDPPDATGGKFYFFAGSATAGTASLASHGTIPDTWGSPKSNLIERIAAASVTPGKPITFILPPQHAFKSVYDGSTWNDATAATVGEPWANGGFRLFYDASMTVAGKYEFEIVEVVEYFHDTHRAFAGPVITHEKGEAVSLAVSAALSQPGSNSAHVESHGGHESMLARIASGMGYMERIGKSALNLMGTAYNAVQGAKMISEGVSAMRAVATAGALVAV